MPLWSRLGEDVVDVVSGTGPKDDDDVRRSWWRWCCGWLLSAVWKPSSCQISAGGENRRAAAAAASNPSTQTGSDWSAAAGGTTTTELLLDDTNYMCVADTLVVEGSFFLRYKCAVHTKLHAGCNHFKQVQNNILLFRDICYVFAEKCENRASKLIWKFLCQLLLFRAVCRGYHFRSSSCLQPQQQQSFFSSRKVCWINDWISSKQHPRQKAFLDRWMWQSSLLLGGRRRGAKNSHNVGLPLSLKTIIHFRLVGTKDPSHNTTLLLHHF